MEGSKKVLRLKISGMHCVMCARSIELALKNQRGVYNVQVNFATSNALLEVDDSFNIKDAEDKIKKMGYQLLSDDKLYKDMSDMSSRLNLMRAIVGILFGTAVMFLMKLPMWGFAEDLLILSSLFVVIFISYPIFVAAIYALKNGNLTMDVMYCLGISMSVISTGLSYFKIMPYEFMMPDTAVMLGSFLMLGRFLEGRTKRKAESSVARLMDLLPHKARVIREGQEIDLDIKSIVPGDIIIVRASEQIPLDGIVISGSAYIDSSMITGEEGPYEVTKDSNVIGGTINLDGLLKIRCTVDYQNSVVMRIIRAAGEAIARRPMIEKISDRIIKYFVPVVLVLAISGFLMWSIFFKAEISFSVMVMISTIVVACPCALGLAVPAAVSVGVGKGSELGLLIKDSSVFEKVESVDTVIFDKTGTLTEGRLSFARCEIFRDIREEEVIKILASIEKGSTHPVAEAILKVVDERGVGLYEPDYVKVEPGKGVVARIGSNIYYVGSSRFMFENAVDLPQVDIGGGIPVFLADSKGLMGYILFNDSIKAESKDVISILKGMGKRVILMSGDNELNVRRLADSVGISEYYSQLLPDEKLRLIEKFRSNGAKILFCGDGINDAPSILASDIGLSVSWGTDIAKEAGDVVLMNDNLRLVYIFFELSRKVMNRIRLNLFWAIFYNAIMIPFAMGLSYGLWGFLIKPELSALAMIFSSLSVMIISLSLYLYRPFDYSS